MFGERAPLLIMGSRRKTDTDKVRHPSPRRVAVHLSIALLLLFVIIGVFAAVMPEQSGSASGMGHLFRSSIQAVVTPRQNQMGLIPAQAATATAVTQDGYEYQGAGGKYSWPDVQKSFTLPDGTSTSSIPTGPTAASSDSHSRVSVTDPPEASPIIATAPATTGSGPSSPLTGTLSANFYNAFTAGNCTYWANYEYHRLTGSMVTWSGDAAAWTSGATSAGWHVSATPHVPSIIVLQPGVQGAGAGSGHVAVVEKLNADGSVATTNWNIAGWGVFSWHTYYAGSGVSFIWR